MTRNNIYYLYSNTDSLINDEEMFPEFHRSKISSTATAMDISINNEVANAEINPIRNEEK